jgi:PfaD family protein
MSMLPIMLALRDEISAAHNYPRPLLVGLGGGIATPASTAAAFAMGAAFVLTGTINQACREAGTSEAVRQMLADARQADIAMAPSADMFELGVKVQVLKRGTMFPLRAARLYEFYRAYEHYEQIPQKQRDILERDFFRGTFQNEWEMTKRYFAERDPGQIERAEKEPRHKMALVFRSYLGRSSLWAKTGDPARRIDYQIWCGPAMGSFNQWVRGSFLEKPDQRRFTCVAMNLLYGAAVTTRANWLRAQGVYLPPGAGTFRPMHLSTIRKILQLPKEQQPPAA